jgi:hypothetical protein
VGGRATSLYKTMLCDEIVEVPTQMQEVEGGGGPARKKVEVSKQEEMGMLKDNIGHVT